MQPGSVISPGDEEKEQVTEQPNVSPEAPATQEHTQPQQQEHTQEPTPPPPSQPAQTFISETEQFTQPNRQPEFSSSSSVTWSASEYIVHHKTGGWYLGLAGVALLASAVIFLVTRDWITFATILIVGLLFGIFASRKPQVLQYTLDESGITIADKHYPYEEFKSFSVLEEGGLSSIFLMPLKRFMPGLSLYYPPDMEEQVVGTMSLYLPHEERQPDMVDRLMKRVRF